MSDEEEKAIEEFWDAVDRAGEMAGYSRQAFIEVIVGLQGRSFPLNAEEVCEHVLRSVSKRYREPIDVFRFGSGHLEAGTDRSRRESRAVLDAPKPFFLDRRDQSPVRDENG